MGRPDLLALGALLLLQVDLAGAVVQLRAKDDASLPREHRTITAKEQRRGGRRKWAGELEVEDETAPLMGPNVDTIQVDDVKLYNKEAQAAEAEAPTELTGIWYVTDMENVSAPKVRYNIYQDRGKDTFYGRHVGYTDIREGKIHKNGTIFWRVAAFKYTGTLSKDWQKITDVHAVNRWDKPAGTFYVKKSCTFEEEAQAKWESWQRKVAGLTDVDENGHVSVNIGSGEPEKTTL